MRERDFLTRMYNAHIIALENEYRRVIKQQGNQDCLVGIVKCIDLIKKSRP